MAYSSEESRAITIHVSDRVYAGLIERGRRAGYTPALYAKLLFEAAYAARVGQGESDPILAACVDQSFARRGEPRVVVRAPIAVEQASAEVVADPEPPTDPIECLTSPPGWSRSQWVLARLVCREQGVAITEAKEALAPAYQTTKGLHVLIHALRPLLRCEGVEVECVALWGWRVEAQTRAAADVFLGRAA